MLYQQIHGEKFIYRYATTSPVQIKECYADHFNINFSKELSMLPEDDR
jgi:hypothetical protein